MADVYCCRWLSLGPSCYNGLCCCWRTPAAAVVFTAVDVPEAPAVAKVSALAAMTTAVEILPVLPATVVSNISSVPALVGVPTVEYPF